MNGLSAIGKGTGGSDSFHGASKRLLRGAREEKVDATLFGAHALVGWYRQVGSVGNSNAEARIRLCVLALVVGRAELEFWV